MCHQSPKHYIEIWHERPFSLQQLPWRRLAGSEEAGDDNGGWCGELGRQGCRESGGDCEPVKKDKVERERKEKNRKKMEKKGEEGIMVISYFLYILKGRWSCFAKRFSKTASAPP